MAFGFSGPAKENCEREPDERFCFCAHHHKMRIGVAPMNSFGRRLSGAVLDDDDVILGSDFALVSKMMASRNFLIRSAFGHG